MNDEPDKSAAVSEVDESPSAILPTEFKSASEILKISVVAMTEFGKIYTHVGVAGFLTIAGVTIALLTIALSFITGTSAQGGMLGGITIWEELLFMAIAVVMITLGVVYLLAGNSAKAGVHKLTTELEREQNRWLHEETMAKFGLPGSQQAGRGPTSAGGKGGQTSQMANVVSTG